MQITQVCNLLDSVPKKSIGNKIGERGATSLGEALKSNATLVKLNLRGKHKKKQYANDIH